jgi:Ca2+/H+ antiporter
VYLLFQLKSHAYMYESTPQHIVDAESTPGPAAAWLDSSDSDDTSSSSSDSDDTSRSRDTVRKRMRKVLRGGRKRKSSITSVDTDVFPTRTPSFGTTGISPAHDETVSEESSSRPPFPRFSSIEGSEEAVEEERHHRFSKRGKRNGRKKHRKGRKHSHTEQLDGDTLQPTISERPENPPENGDGEPRRVDFAVQDLSGIDGNTDGTQGGTKRPFQGIRGMSVRNLAPTVFAQRLDTIPMPPVPTGPVPRIRYGIRRTNSLPDRLNQYQFRPPGAMLPSQIPLMALTGGTGAKDKDEREEGQISRTAAIILLLVSTALVAVCAEFLVDSIKDVVDTGSVGEIFIGLIILPIVGNAAEHVTAITVAMKNKMDLAIGVAVGSSIQIALFITPLIVILGWIIDREMTLYFTLFETVCLFVSTFIVNFLVLDGRSNYLEGALLCSTYIIISVVAYFYPDEKDASSWGV